MPRYYVSFSHQVPTGLAVDSVDVTTTDLIATVADLHPVYAQLARQGYTNKVKILAFSLYAAPRNNPAPKPQTRPAPQPARRRPSPRPGRHS